MSLGRVNEVLIHNRAIMMRELGTVSYNNILKKYLKVYSDRVNRGLREAIVFKYLPLCPTKEESRLVLYGLKKDN